MAMTGKLVRNVLTAPNENAAQKQTVLTLDFTGVTDAAAMAYMTRSITIDLQRGWRKNGIPAAHTVKVSELVAGVKHAEPITVESEKARAAVLSGEDLKKLVEDLQKKIAADAEAAKAKK